MTLIEGIGDEVIQFFVALFFVLIVALAWCTTNISNEGSLRTVFLLERRRLRAARRLTNHTESATIVEGTTVEDLEAREPPPTMEEDKPPEASSTSDACDQTTQVVDEEETRIVEAMDAPRDSQSSNDLRRRRLAFYNRSSEDKSSNPSYSTASMTGSSAEANQSGNCVKDNIKCSKGKSGNQNKSEERVTSDDSDRICVKLMYLNDELRHVDGRLHEKLGDFKRRHFQVELEANKLVKLIFNGHVLQQDADTLQRCGLFDNCVVHCLIHNRAATSSQGGNAGGRESSRSTPLGFNSHTNNNNQPYEWHLENYLFAILCCFLGFAWYLRYVYAHLYTVTATIGLILMTGIFTIIMFGMHFPDNVELNQQRTENVQSHQ